MTRTMDAGHDVGRDERNAVAVPAPRRDGGKTDRQRRGRATCPVASGGFPHYWRAFALGRE